MNRIRITAKELSPGDRVNLHAEDGSDRFVMVGQVAINLCYGTVQVIAQYNGILQPTGEIGADIEVEVMR